MPQPFTPYEPFPSTNGTEERTVVLSIGDVVRFGFRTSLPADRIVAGIYIDLMDRPGFREAWHALTSDEQDKLVTEWVEFARKESGIR